MTISDFDEVEQALRAGQVVGVPTDTVYGLAVDPRLPGVVNKLFALKGRPIGIPLPVLVADPAELVDLATVEPAVGRLVARYWPGPLTLVLPRRAGIDFELGGRPETIGVRCPSQTLLRELLRRTGPLAVTSANRHGEPPLCTAEEVRERFGVDVAHVLDGGICDDRPSTVVDASGAQVRCLRQGSLLFAEIAALAAP
ncbi:MAG: L-threonylcarbamoyladenylate synthase [Acidimicrobiales bacterium]|jgi:tRNA threonylcarbamoyl adenosine modification protein (Sua5/YciO/YrdC/YwlC family)